LSLVFKKLMVLATISKRIVADTIITRFLKELWLTPLSLNLVGISNKYKDQVKKLFSSTLPGREKLMTLKEQEYFKALPDTLTIYRTMTINESLSKDYGISWTLDKKVAEYFRVIYNRNKATRNEPKTIIELQIKKIEAIAFFAGRKETEIIYLNKK